MSTDEAASWYRRIGSEGFRPLISEGDGRNWLPALMVREEDTGIHDGDRLNTVVFVDGVLTYSDEVSWLAGIPTVNDPYQR